MTTLHWADGRVDTHEVVVRPYDHTRPC